MRVMTVGKRDGKFIAFLDNGKDAEQKFDLKSTHLEHAEIEALQKIDFECDLINLMNVSRKNIILPENKLIEDEIHKKKNGGGDGYGNSGVPV